MAAVMSWVGTGSRALSYLLGLLVFATAGAVLLTAQPAGAVIDWARGVLGVSFILLLLALIYTTLFCWLRIIRSGDQTECELWLEAGLNAANGVGTLALTYTLLGISLGIGTLADQDLSPDTIQAVIKELTEHFSMAFLTTVIGLPVAAVLRALVSVAAAHRHTVAVREGQ